MSTPETAKPAEKTLEEVAEDVRHWRIDRYLGCELLKTACYRKGHYRMQVVTGDVIQFTEAFWQNAEWVLVRQGSAWGMHIRLSSIVWVMEDKQP